MTKNNDLSQLDNRLDRKKWKTILEDMDSYRLYIRNSRRKINRINNEISAANNTGIEMTEEGVRAKNEEDDQRNGRCLEMTGSAGMGKTGLRNNRA